MTTQPTIIEKIVAGFSTSFKTIFSKAYFSRFIMFIIIVILGFLLAFNFKCNKKDGASWEPAGKINFTKELKK